MKKLSLLFALVIAQILITFYFVNELLVPYDSLGALIVGNYYIVTISISSCVFLSFSLVYIILDKLFIRKFDEPLRFWLGLRRGFLVGTVFALYLFFRIWGYKEDIYLYSIALITLCIEVLITLIFSSNRKLSVPNSEV
jgi:hypothetical protein